MCRQSCLQVPKPGEIYRHFKGDRYRILAIARHTETGEALVVYCPVDSAIGVWARPLSMFEEMLVSDGATVKRFELES